ncbi:MAG TPA: hypothetical protein VGX96_06945 [Candidatus Elarobacter sp.]|nr:hypothetical protein [Candidatus Elarobacter sp.]
MRRQLGLVTAVAALMVAAPAPGRAEPPDPAVRQGLKAVQFLVGRWNCAHTVGDFSGTYTTSFAPALDGEWLKQRYDFPATKTDPAWYGEFYWGYDPRVPRWVRFGAMSNGMYFGMVSKNANAETMVFDYRLPGAGTSATWTKKSNTEFTIDGPSYIENGKPVTEHHDCKKAS